MLCAKSDKPTRGREGYQNRTSQKEIVGKGSKPKTIIIQEAPTREVAPKLENKCSESVVVAPMEMQFWQDLNQNQIIV